MKNYILILFILFSCTPKQKISKAYLVHAVDQAWVPVDHSTTFMPERKIRKIKERLRLPENADTTIFYNCNLWAIIFNEDTTTKDVCKQITYIRITKDKLNETYHPFGIKKWERMVLTDEDKKNIVYEPSRERFD